MSFEMNCSDGHTVESGDLLYYKPVGGWVFLLLTTSFESYGLGCSKNGEVHFRMRKVPWPKFYWTKY